MPRVFIVEGFPFAIDGNHVIQIDAGEQDVSERCAEVAIAHFGASLVGESTPPVQKDSPSPKPAAKPKAMAKPKVAAKPKPSAEA